MKGACLRMTVITLVLEIIKQAQSKEVKEENQKSERIVGHISAFDVDSHGLLTLHCRIWVPYLRRTQQIMMDDAHNSMFSIHLGATNMYRDLIHSYWWTYMKRGVAWYVDRCLTCRTVKAEHQMSHGKLQPLYISKWKWE